MQSIIVNRGNHLMLEIDMGRSTGIDRSAAACAALAGHGLREGQVVIKFVNHSTMEAKHEQEKERTAAHFGR